MDNRVEACLCRWEPPDRPPSWSETTSCRALVRSRRLDWVRLELLAKRVADLAMAWRYLVATRVSVSRAESWVVLKPTDRQIWETAILAIACENSDGVVVVDDDVAVWNFAFLRDFDFIFGSRRSRR